MPTYTNHTESKPLPAEQRPYFVKRTFSNERPLEDMLVHLIRAHS